MDYSITQKTTTFGPGSQFVLAGPGLRLRFAIEEDRLAFLQMHRSDAPAVLFPAHEKMGSGPGAIEGPLTIVVRCGPGQGKCFGLESFRLVRHERSETRLLAYLEHDDLPLLFHLEVTVEGNVASWRGQAAWNGDEVWEADFYYPIFTSVDFPDAQNSRVMLAANSGMETHLLAEATVSRSYLGNLSSPVMLVQGDGHGLAFLEDSLADLAADAGACVQRGFAAGGHFPPVQGKAVPPIAPFATTGAYVAAWHTRRFRQIADLGLTEADMEAESWNVTEWRPPMWGDAVDLGPVRVYAYPGGWKTGASWLRERRQHLPLRISPASWWKDATFLSEAMGDSMVRRGQSFHDYPALLDENRLLGSDLFHLPGFHDPEVLGEGRNWLNRGDYLYAAENLGGMDAARQGIAATHRRGGHILYYVEGLIVWKRSRIGRSRGRAWALMNEDGSYMEHYKGFWHPCPACPEWADWLARTCAEVVRTTGVDGFFIDSIGATSFHRCFNPEHNHPHPDVWNWGVRNLLRRIREEVDKANPETILLIEGAADLAREFVDGSLSHTHDWGRRTFTVPLLRYMHPEMNVFESWGGSAAPDDVQDTPQKLHIWNAVHGHRIYAHEPERGTMAEISGRTRRYYDAFPEICHAPLSLHDPLVEGDSGIAAHFDSAPGVVTVGNQSETAQTIRVTLPATIAAGILFDRVTNERIPVIGNQATIALPPYGFQVFEIRR